MLELVNNHLLRWCAYGLTVRLGLFVSCFPDSVKPNFFSKTQSFVFLPSFFTNLTELTELTELIKVFLWNFSYGTFLMEVFLWNFIIMVREFCFQKRLFFYFRSFSLSKLRIVILLFFISIFNSSIFKLRLYFLNLTLTLTFTLKKAFKPNFYQQKL